MSTHQQNSRDEVIDLLSYAELVFSKKKLLCKIVLACLLVSTGVCLLLPNWYKCTVMILPPQQDSGLMGLMLGQIGGGSSFAGELLGKGSPADLYATVASSNVVSDRIIDKYKLMEVYNKKFRGDMYRVLDKYVVINVGKKDGILSITVEDKDPKRAANIADSYIDEISAMSIKLATAGPSENRVFLADRIAKTKIDLKNAEDKLKDFQLKYKAPDITEQAKGTILGVANLEANLALEEVKLSGLKRTYTDNSQEIKNQKAVVASIHSQIDKLEGVNRASGNALPGLGSVPAIGQEYFRLMRELKIQESIFELLTKQLEFAKLSENRNVSNIQIIQSAKVPDIKSSPKRAFIIIFSSLLALITSVIYIFIANAYNQLSINDKGRIKRLLTS